MGESFKAVFDSINQFFAFIGPISDWIWEFPTQYAFYKSIPILGQLAFPIILLFGVGIYFSFRTGFVALYSFRHSTKILLSRQPSKTGVSALSAFMLGLAMRVGPGNIVGITGAISIGGPGALFWMWVAAFFGMTTAFMEAVLAQIFKEKKDDQFVGGLPFYGKYILGNKRIAGVLLSLAFIVYALFNIPGQTFNVFTAAGVVIENATGETYGRQSTLYFAIAAVLVISSIFMIFGGVRRVIKYVNVLVPLKAVLFLGISLILVILNYPLIPYFFKAVIGGAISPEALFGGAIGTAIAQGVKRGLMSNEAGQGTITMAAAVADNRHPCEQGFVQSFGVFVDTMIICTLTGFVVVMAHLWVGTSGEQWEVMRASKIGLYLESVKTLTPDGVERGVKVIMGICYGLFAFTTLLGMISFAEISMNFISRSSAAIAIVRILGACVFVPFGALSVLAELELGNLWAISDLSNIMMVYLNVPILLLGAPIVYRALKHYKQFKKDPTAEQFNSEKAIGVKTEFWR